MQSRYYEVSDPTEAFEKASKDPRTWDFDFATLEAFQAMATAASGRFCGHHADGS